MFILVIKNSYTFAGKFLEYEKARCVFGDVMLCIVLYGTVAGAR